MVQEHDGTGEERANPLSSQDKFEVHRMHKSLIYELFVLGELLDGPRHGYQLREILSRLLGPFRQISWGMLYPLIRQLEREGLLASESESIAEEPERGGASARQRKPYAITATGRERFYALMIEQGDYSADYRELFIVKLNNFDYLSPGQQLAVLWQYRGYLQVEDFYLSGGQQHVLNNPYLSDQHRVHILHIMSFRWSGIQGEMHWIEEQIKRLEEETGEAS